MSLGVFLGSGGDSDSVRQNSLGYGLSGGAAADAAKESARSQAEVAERTTATNIAESRRQFDIGQANLEEIRQFTLPALEQVSALSGAGGQQAQAAAIGAFQDSPGQQFLRERGERALVRNASAVGGLGGGNVRSALVEQGVGFAQQDFANQFNRLAGLAGVAQTTTSEQGRAGERFAGNIAEQNTNLANARISGIQAQAQAAQNQSQQQQQLAGSALGLGVALFSDVRLKENICKIGELPSGLGWYTWDWKEDLIVEEDFAMLKNFPKEGVLAQEVVDVFPEAVMEVDHHLAIDYTRIH